MVVTQAQNEESDSENAEHEKEKSKAVHQAAAGAADNIKVSTYFIDKQVPVDEKESQGNLQNIQDKNKVQTDKYKYFGFTKKDTDKQAKETLENGYMENLFYVNDDEFALKIYNKDKTEQMILYLTDSQESFETIYNEILEKNKYKNEYIRTRAKEAAEKYGSFARFKFHNYYKIPFMHIDKQYNYDKKLANKPIKDKSYNATGNTWTILKTQQTIKFDMNNEGAKLKSEAAIAVMKNTAVHESDMIINIDNNYFFDRPFVIFLKETGKTKPYFAARVKNGKFLVKE